MRVLRLIDNIDLRDGGPPAGVQMLDDELRSRGHRVHTMAMAKRGQVTGRPHPDDVTLPAFRALGRGFSLPLLHAAWRTGPDVDVVVMHGFYLWHNIVAWLVAVRFGVPLILQPHGVFERYQRKEKRAVKGIFDSLVGGRILRQVSCVLVASDAEVTGVSDVFGGPVSVVGIGVRRAPVEPRSHARSPVNLLSLSRIAPKKRVDVVIETVSILRQQGIEASCVIAGSGSQELLTTLRGLADELGVASHIEWAGHVTGSGKVKAFANADVYLLPSENENFAISVAEAMAHGVPCVVTRDVAMSSVVARGAGVVIPVPDARALAEAIEQLVDASVYAPMSRAALTLARQELSWEAVANRWEQAMGDIQKA